MRLKRRKEEFPATPDVKKEDQECFEDDKVKEEPHKSEQGWDQKDEQVEETEKLHRKNIRNDVLLYMLTAKSKKVNKYEVESLKYKLDLQNSIACKMLKKTRQIVVFPICPCDRICA